MGCGESKHAVSTENTLTKSKSKSKSFKNNSPPAEKATNDANVNPTPVQEPSNEVKGSGDDHELVGNKIPEAIKDERLENAEVGTGNPGEKLKGGDENAKANETPIVAAKVEEYKGEEKGEEVVGQTKGDEEMKGGEFENEKVEAKEKVDIVDQEVVKLASHGSPNHVFSPKRDHEETIDTIIPDGISGKSDYKGKTEEKVEDAEVKPDAEKAAEVIKVDEAKKVGTVDETEVSANEGDEKTTAAGDEHAQATPSDDVKAN